MYERVLARNEAMGTTQLFRYDPVEDVTELVTITDATPILEAANDQKKEFRGPGGGQWGKGFVKVASIPMTLYQDLMDKGIARDPKALARWCNQSENAVFRTRPGRV